MTATKRAAIYTRVSSAGQEDNYSLQTQEEACRTFASERGWEIAGVFSDVHTRVELWERPQLSALREVVRKRQVDAIICLAIDRLSGDPVHLGVILSEADHAGAEVAFVTEPLDDSPEGQLIRFVRGYAAKVEHEKIKERSMRGKIARVQSGKPAVGPRPPFGYRWRDDRDKDGKSVKLRYEEDPDTAWIVRRIFAEVASGSSARQSALRLTAERIPTPTGREAWSRATVIKLLTNPAYTGDARGLRHRRQRVKGRGWVYSSRPEPEQVALPGVAPPLVAADQASAAIAQLTVNKAVATRNNHNPEAALLRGGFARCGFCGTVLQAHNGEFGPAYRHNQTTRDIHRCPYFSIQTTILDAAVWEGIRERLTNRELIAAELQRLKTEDPTRADTATLDRRIGEVARRQRNLMARLADEDIPEVAALIRADLAGLLDEKRQLECERESLEQQREGWRSAQARLHELDLWVQNVSANLDDFDYAKKRMALQELQVEVRVWPKSHEKRYEVTMRHEVVTTTSRCC